MTTAIVTNSETVSKVRFHGHYLTVKQIEDYLEAADHHREGLIASEKARLRATILLDSDYDRIEGWMNLWRHRYLKAVS